MCAALDKLCDCMLLRPEGTVVMESSGTEREKERGRKREGERQREKGRGKNGTRDRAVVGGGQKSEDERGSPEIGQSFKCCFN